MKSKFDAKYDVVRQQFNDEIISKEEFMRETLMHVIAMEWSHHHSERIKAGLRKKKEREEQEKKKII